MANGDTFDGNFSGGLKSGKGRYCFADGRVYEGNFEDNTFCG